jgi:hypothetical protein
MGTSLRGPAPTPARPGHPVGARRTGRVRVGTRRAGRGRAQNLMLPIIPAMFVVSSLIVGATVEEAR